MRNEASRFREQSQELHISVRRIADRFRLSLVKEEADAYGLEAVLQNAVAGVKFEFSPQDESGWRVVVGRLIDGRFPRHPIRIDPQTSLNRFDLRDIAALRISLIPELAEKIGALAPLTVQDVGVILERCCADIFQGDFSLFPQLNERVLSRLPASTKGVG